MGNGVMIHPMHRRLGSIGLLILALTIWAPAQRTPTSQPVLIDAADKPALESAIGRQVVIHGTISAAAWSRSGAVMNIDFAGTEQSRFLAVVFQRSKQDFDTAFNGDALKTLIGAKVRLRGTLERYGGQQEEFKGRPQLILSRPDQVTVVEPARSVFHRR